MNCTSLHQCKMLQGGCRTSMRMSVLERLMAVSHSTSGKRALSSLYRQELSEVRNRLVNRFLPYVRFGIGVNLPVAPLRNRQLLGVKLVRGCTDKCAFCQTRRIRYVKRVDESVGYCNPCLDTACRRKRERYFIRRVERQPQQSI